MFWTASHQSRVELSIPIRELSLGPTLVMDRDSKVTDNLNALHFFSLHCHLKIFG